MAEEKKKKERKFYQKKRYRFTFGFILFLGIAAYYGNKWNQETIEACNNGSIEKCKEIENDSPYLYDSKEGRSKITNPYFKEKFKKLDAIEDAVEKKKAEEQIKRDAEREALEKKKAEEQIKRAEEKRKRAEEQKRYEAQFNKIILCKMLLQENLKDPSSFKELNNITEQIRTGIIRYSATNSFGGRIQSSFNCNQ